VIDFANLQEPILGSKLPSRVPDNASEVPDIDPDIWKDESEDDEVRETDPEGDYYFVILCNKFFLYLAISISFILSTASLQLRYILCRPSKKE
jgi:hypothetical protein